MTRFVPISWGLGRRPRGRVVLSKNSGRIVSQGSLTGRRLVRELCLILPVVMHFKCFVGRRIRGQSGLTVLVKNCDGRGGDTRLIIFRPRRRPGRRRRVTGPRSNLIGKWFNVLLLLYTFTI